MKGKDSKGSEHYEESKYNSQTEEFHSEPGKRVMGVKREYVKNFSNITSNITPPTVGLEFEVYRVQGLTPDQKKAYKEQFDKATKARIIHELNVQDILSEESKETSALCVISHKREVFMEVTFDDLAKNEMNRLEFISAGKAGILPYKKFFTEANLNMIKNCIAHFPDAVEKLRALREPKKLKTIKVGNFEYTIPQYATDIILSDGFQEEQLQGAGQVHVTHLVPLTLLEHGIDNFEKFRKAYNPSAPKILEWDYKGKAEFTANRHEASPSLKYPIDLLRDGSDAIKKIKDGELLPPMHNLSKDIENDIKLYKEVLNSLKSASEKLDPEDKSKGSIQKKIEILTSTIEYYEDKITDKTNNKYKGKIKGQTGKVRIFNSPEGKFLPLIGDNVLVEHRSGKLVDLCANYVKDIAKAQRKELNVIINHFDSLTKAVSVQKWTKADQSASVERLTQGRKDTTPVYDPVSRGQRSQYTYSEKSVPVVNHRGFSQKARFVASDASDAYGGEVSGVNQSTKTMHSSKRGLSSRKKIGKYKSRSSNQDMNNSLPTHVDVHFNDPTGQSNNARASSQLFSVKDHDIGSIKNSSSRDRNVMTNTGMDSSSVEDAYRNKPNINGIRLPSLDKKKVEKIGDNLKAKMSSSRDRNVMTNTGMYSSVEDPYHNKPNIYKRANGIRLPSLDKEKVEKIGDNLKAKMSVAAQQSISETLNGTSINRVDNKHSRNAGFRKFP